MQSDLFASNVDLNKSNEWLANRQDLDSDICRDFLRNVCKRGRKCRFKHPNEEQCEKLRVELGEPVFCHDYQNGLCRRPACKFLHFTKDEEEVYRQRGSSTSSAQANQAAIQSEHPPVVGKKPICKDFLNHNCHRGSSCKFRHIKITEKLAQFPFPPPLAPQQATLLQQYHPSLEASVEVLTPSSSHLLLPPGVNFSTSVNSSATGPSAFLLPASSSASTPTAPSPSLLLPISQTVIFESNQSHRTGGTSTTTYNLVRQPVYATIPTSSVYFEGTSNNTVAETVPTAINATASSSLSSASNNAGSADASTAMVAAAAAAGYHLAQHLPAIQKQHHQQQQQNQLNLGGNSSGAGLPAASAAAAAVAAAASALVAHSRPAQQQTQLITESVGMPVIHSGVQLVQHSDIAYTSLATNQSGGSAVILRPSNDLTGHHINHHHLGLASPTTVVVSQQQQLSQQQQRPQSRVSLITAPSELSSKLCAETNRSFVTPGCLEAMEVGSSTTGTFHAFVTNDACQGSVGAASRSQPITFTIPVSSCAYVTATTLATNDSASSSITAFSAPSSSTLSCVPSLSSVAMASSSVSGRCRQQQEANTAAAVAAAACFGAMLSQPVAAAAAASRVASANHQSAVSCSASQLPPSSLSSSLEGNMTGTHLTATSATSVAMAAVAAAAVAAVVSSSSSLPISTVTSMRQNPAVSVTGLVESSSDYHQSADLLHSPSSHIDSSQYIANSLPASYHRLRKAVCRSLRRHHQPNTLPEHYSPSPSNSAAATSSADVNNQRALMSAAAYTTMTTAATAAAMAAAAAVEHQQKRAAAAAAALAGNVVCSEPTLSESTMHMDRISPASQSSSSPSPTTVAAYSLRSTSEHLYHHVSPEPYRKRRKATAGLSSFRRQRQPSFISEEEEDEDYEEEDEEFENYNMGQSAENTVGNIYNQTPVKPHTVWAPHCNTMTVSMANKTATSTVRKKIVIRRCKSVDHNVDRSSMCLTIRRRCTSETFKSSDALPLTAAIPPIPPRKVISKPAPVWRQHYYSFKRPTSVTTRKRNIRSRLDIETEFDETFDDDEYEEEGVYWEEREEDAEDEEFYHVPAVYSRASKQMRKDQHHRQHFRTLKLENNRLRCQLQNLLQQRNELQATNQLLVKQNMRLRKSNKRAVAVVRATEQSMVFGHFRPQSNLLVGKLKSKMLCPSSNNNSSCRISGPHIVSGEQRFLSANSASSATQASGRRFTNGRLDLSNCSRVLNTSADVPLSNLQTSVDTRD